jgi:hypothetical protein
MWEVLFLGVSLTRVFFWWTNQRATSPKGKKENVFTNYYFMLVLFSERAHSQFFFPLSKGDI